MSWDVIIFNLRGASPPSLEQLRKEDFAPLGPADEVRRCILSFLPCVDWSDPTWGLFGGDGFSIEFNVGKDEPIKHLMLHVHGGGDAISAITTFARPLGWSALDCSSGQFLDLDHPSKTGWEGFQAYRDQVIATYREEEAS